MEEAAQLLEYLPLSFKSSGEQEYIDFLWNAFETNCSEGRYQFAFLAYHMLTMCFVYFELWQIRHARPDDFAKALIGFGKDEEAKLLGASIPFVFSIIRERTVLRLLKLVACDNDKIGAYAKLVDDRNEAAHPNGHIFYSSEPALAAKVNEVLRVVDEIHRHNVPVIEEAYRQFLVESLDPDTRAYPDERDQIREVLVHDNYFSRKDIEVCLQADLGSLLAVPEKHGVEELHTAMVQELGQLEGA